MKDETCSEVTERLTRAIAAGALTVPCALSEAYLAGNRAGWIDAQRMRAAEIKPNRRRARSRDEEERTRG